MLTELRIAENTTSERKALKELIIEAIRKHVAINHSVSTNPISVKTWIADAQYEAMALEIISIFVNINYDIILRALIQDEIKK